MTAPSREELLRALAEARARGFLGPGPVEAHLDQASVLVATLMPPSGRCLDLGSGAGVPGLLLAAAWPSSRWTLLDAHRRRAVFAREAARGLGAGDRVDVLGVRAEEAGRDAGLRGGFELVVARGFGPPATTAECAAPFLAVGGSCFVSEPPEERAERWPAEGLAVLGLEDAGAMRAPGGGWRHLRAVGPCPDAYPRRTGVPVRRPLF